MPGRRRCDDRSLRRWPSRGALVSGAKGAGIGRVSTRIPGLDTIIGSDLLQGGIHTVQGTPSAGKTNARSSRGGQPGVGANVLTVLVVDDESDITELLGTVLTEEGYRVLTAMNGREGLDLLAREQPQLVFCDHMMPVVDGVAMLEAMAADPVLRRIPVVMMSALPEKAVAELCSGYVTFLHKPFKLPQFLDVVERLLGTGNVRAF